jgi:hypothetical protein
MLSTHHLRVAGRPAVIGEPLASCADLVRQGVICSHLRFEVSVLLIVSRLITSSCARSLGPDYFDAKPLEAAKHLLGEASEQHMAVRQRPPASAVVRAHSHAVRHALWRRQGSPLPTYTKALPRLGRLRG